MKKLLRNFKSSKVNLLIISLVTLVLAFSQQRSYAQFTVGNVVVDQVGNGKFSDLYSASQVKLLQFTPAGVAQPSSPYFGYTGTSSDTPFNLVQSYLAGDGFISLSGNKKFIVVPGYNAAAGTPLITFSKTNSTSFKNGRTVGKVFATDSIKAKGTFNALSGGNFGSVVCKDANYYLGGWGGIAYSYRDTTPDGIGKTISLYSHCVNVLHVFEKTLFASIDSGSTHGIWQVGDFKTLPTSGTPALVNIINTGKGSTPYAFTFSPEGTTCYIADDRPLLLGNGGGIQKWVYSGTFSKRTGWSGGTWSLAYTLSTGSSVGARGLTVDFTGTNPIIYATTADVFNNKLISITDVGASSVAKTLATAPNFYAFKGVALAPEPKNTVDTVPTITTTALTPSSVSTVYGTSSSDLVFNISGSDLQESITVTPPAGFEVSLSPTSGFAGSVEVGTTGTLASTPVYVRLKSTDLVGSYSGTISCESDEATTQYVTIGSSAVTPAALTVTANSTSKLYGTTLLFAGTEFTTTGLVNGDQVVSASISSPGAAESAQTGTYPISITTALGFGLTNYTISYVAGTLTVTPAALTVTANNQNKCPGFTLNLGTTAFTASGLVNNDVVSSVTLSSSGAAGSASNGTYDIVPSAAVGTGLNNYTISYVNGTLTVGLEQGLAITLIQVNPDCNALYGSLSSTIANGTPPYTYTLIDNNRNVQTSSNPLFNNLPAAGYSYSAIDAAGCTTTAPPITLAPLTQTPIIITNNSTQVCYGGTTTITTDIVGGNPPFLYSLNGGPFVPSANRYFNVTAFAGGYTITVEDGNSCSITTDPVTITQPSAAINLTATFSDASCTSNIGSITITATGGYGGYTYSDNAGATYQPGPVFSGLPYGNYTLTAEDQKGCPSQPFVVKLGPLTASAITGNTQVCYGAVGSISTTGSGGVAPYTYSLDQTEDFVPSNERFFTVGAGTHTITVMDYTGCTYTTAPIVITEASAPVTFTNKGAVGCSGTGTITVSASGGYGNYSYSDDGGNTYQSDSVFTVPYGNYTIAVKDEAGCIPSSTSKITLTALSTSNIVGNTTVCPGGTTTISTVPAGGTTPYTYSLDGGPFVQSSLRYFNVPAGTDSITVKDSTGCTVTTPPVTITTIDCSGPIGLSGNHDGVGTNTVISNVKGVGAVFEAHLSPNPSPSAFHLQLQSGSTDDVELTVTNILGVKVYEGRGSINGAYDFGANFKDGIYILQIMQGNTIHTLKLIKGK